MEVAPASEARSFGKYTLVAKLATGGMAEIFLARLHGDGGFEKLVCIKRILPHLAKDPQFVAMFLDEARVAARISHPNVCQVFELGEWHNQYYIAMEYLEGVPLSCFRRTDFYPMPPDPRLVAGFGVQACEGLHHAHQLKQPDGELLGVVHRDVSPQNLFATTDGIVKVLDFGIAKVQDASVRTSTGAVKGTYAYMSPEQLRNETLDRRSDVWALGIVLWEALAQRHLFKRDTEFLTFEAITKLPIPDICEVRPDVPPLLGDTIARSLARNRDDRFASARAFGEALAQAVAPLGGAFTAAAISDEVNNAFQGMLAEQRMLLRIAREGGAFDLENESALVGHGTQMATTPVSNIKRRVAEAKAEVANFVAAKNAIDSLVEDEYVEVDDPSDGAFTPAPSRTAPAQPVPPRSQPMAAQRRSEPMAAQRRSEPMAAQRRSRPFAAETDPTSGPYNVAPAEWRSRDDTPLPVPAPQSTVIQSVRPPSRLPWIVATIAVAAATGIGVMLWMELRDKRTQPTSGSASQPIVMHDEATPPAPTPGALPAQPAAADAAVAVAQAEPEDARLATIAPDAATPVTPTVADATPKPEQHPPKPKLPQIKQPPPPPPPPVPAGPPGFITIDSTPVYAVIFIDGKRFGETPLVNIKLPPGKHAVKAVSQSGTTRTLSIAIESGKTAPVRRIEW